jgi:hypothetical protein
MTGTVSGLWESLSRTHFAKVDDEFLSSFRMPGGPNSRLAAWDPLDPTMRYFKFLMFGSAIRQSERFYDLYRALGKVDIGGPVHVTAGGCRINIDYLFSIEEFLFVDSVLPTSGLRSVVEIGAGFGRTCHAFLALAPAIERYTIIDIGNVLTLSQAVLSRVVPDQFHKIEFIDAQHTHEWRGLAADLAINIDSFQEMPPSTIDMYMRDLIAVCTNLYVKNPIAKYAPESIGVSVPRERLHDVFALGYCRDVVDIFDEAQLKAARTRYLEAYRPSPEWRLIGDQPLEAFPYLHHALFARRLDQRPSAVSNAG